MPSHAVLSHLLGLAELTRSESCLAGAEGAVQAVRVALQEMHHLCVEVPSVALCNLSIGHNCF